MRNGVTVERVGSTDYPRHQMRRRVSNYLTYLALAVPRAIALRPDIVLSMTDPPVAGIAAAFVARRLGRPFVYNVQDLYPDMAVGGDIVRPGFWVRRWEKMHRRALQQAARVIVIGDDMRDRILAKGVASRKSRSRTQWHNASASLAGVKRRDCAKCRPGNPLRLPVCGRACRKSGVLRRLGHAAQGRGNSGQRKHRLGVHRRRGKPRGASGFRVRIRRTFAFCRSAPSSKCRRSWRPATCTSSPYAAVSRALSSPASCTRFSRRGARCSRWPRHHSDAASVVVESGCGLAADPDDPAAVASAIRELRGDPSRLAEMGRRARETSKKYARVTQLERFVEIIEEVARDSHGARSEL